MRFLPVLALFACAGGGTEGDSDSGAEPTWTLELAGVSFDGVTAPSTLPGNSTQFQITMDVRYSGPEECVTCPAQILFWWDDGEHPGCDPETPALSGAGTVEHSVVGGYFTPWNYGQHTLHIGLASQADCEAVWPVGEDIATLALVSEDADTVDIIPGDLTLIGEFTLTNAQTPAQSLTLQSLTGQGSPWMQDASTAASQRWVFRSGTVADHYLLASDRHNGSDYGLWSFGEGQLTTFVANDGDPDMQWKVVQIDSSTEVLLQNATYGSDLSLSADTGGYATLQPTDTSDAKQRWTISPP